MVKDSEIQVAYSESPKGTVTETYIHNSKDNEFADEYVKKNQCVKNNCMVKMSFESKFQNSE